MSGFDPHAEGRALFARADEWEAAGASPRAVFHAYARAFGHALSRYCEPDVAVAFLLQEVGRIEALARSTAPETLQ